MASVTADNPDGLSIELRALLVEFQRGDLARVAIIRRMVNLPPVMTADQWRRREQRGGHGASDDGREEGRG